MTFNRDGLVRAILAVALLSRATAQSSAQSPVVIPSLANDTNPSDLDFQGAECVVERSGQAMSCDFQQVFLTVSPLDAQTCLATTNRYARTFQRQSEGVWISRDEPEGDCGLTETTTLKDDGDGRRWTMELRRTRTRKTAPACRGDDPPVEIFSWRNARRALPCRFIQPGALR